MEQALRLRILPYTSFQSAIPAMALVAVNVTRIGSPSIQMAGAFLVLLFAAPYLRIRLDSTVLMIGYMAICIAAGIWIYGTHQSITKAGKILLYGLAAILTIKGIRANDPFPALVALRAFLVLCFLNLCYAIGTGSQVFRGAHLIEFSIYSSYTIAFLIYMARKRLTLFDRVFAIIFTVLTGSTMGLLLLFLADVVGRKLRISTIIGLVALSPIGIFGLNWLMVARGKELSLEYLITSDRGRIFEAFYETVLPLFGSIQWLFGLGVGYPLHQFQTKDVVFDNYLRRVGEGEIYSFCLHNEVLRILCDYGLIGLLLVFMHLSRTFKSPVLILILVCTLTNSYLYSFSGALILSGMFYREKAK